MRSQVLLRMALAAAGLALSCGSEPLNEDSGDASAPGTGGSGASGGTSGSGASGGSRAAGGSAGMPMIPDYSDSPCYGESATTDVYELGTHEVFSVTATCRAEGERTRLYVADDLWEVAPSPGAPLLTQEEVNTFLYRYELAGQAGSYRPDLGVFPTDELVFGAIAAEDLSDGKLPIFVISSGGAGEGYLCGWCDRLELHLDGPLLRSLRSDETLSIAAHETFHAIHRSHDPNEAFWVDETLAEAAMTVNGFFTDDAWLGAFLHDPNRAWGPSLDDPRDFDYGAGLLFGSYLWEHGGAELLAAITAEPRDSWAGIDAALASTGSAETGWELYLDMALAAYFDDPAKGYAFESFELADRIVPVSVGAGTEHADTIEPYGLVYIALTAGARSLTLQTTADVSARLALATAPAYVSDVVSGEPLDFGGSPALLVLTAPERASFTLSVQ